MGEVRTWPLYFCRVNEPWGEFSNFAKYPFEAESEDLARERTFLEENVRWARTTQPEWDEIGASAMRSDWEIVKVEVTRSPSPRSFPGQKNQLFAAGCSAIGSASWRAGRTAVSVIGTTAITRVPCPME